MIEGTIFYIFVGIFLAIITVFFIYITRVQYKNNIKSMLTRKLLLVRLPNNFKKSEGKSFIEDINRSEQFFSMISSMGGIVSMEVATHNIGENINFYVSVLEKNVESVSRGIEGIFDGAIIDEVNEYNIFHNNGVNAGVYLKQKNSYALPMHTYTEISSDTFSPILNGISKINEIGEGVAIQVIIKPAPKSYKKNIIKIVDAIKKGETLKNASKGANLDISDLSNIFSNTNNKKDQSSSSVIDEKALALIEEKLSKQLLEVNYRIIVSSSVKYQTDAILKSITSPFSQFDAPLKNGIKIIKIKDMHSFSYDFSFRKMKNKQSMILNTQELASMFHFPTSSTLSPKINWVKSREVAPPVGLSKNGVKIGETSYRGEHIPVYISDNDRKRHIYIIGQTGTGKSTVMVNMAVDDMQKGKGIAVMDPHGDLIEKISGLVPDERKDDVIIFNPSNVSKPIGLNMLEYNFSKPEEKTFIVNELLDIFSKLFVSSGDALGPMFQMYMRNAILLLLEDAKNEPATLMEVQRVFTDEEYRTRKLHRISNPVVIDFWTREANKAGGDASLANVAPYVTSKFNNFTANDYMRPIIGQTKSAFKFREIMDEGKILLINLSKGLIGDLNAGLLGMTITGKILIAALGRADIPEENRRDFNLYIDEFQNFTTNAISTMFSEARKYNLSLTVAHQFIAQLEEKTVKAVFGNVGSILAFRIGVNDAEVLEKQFSPVFSQEDFINIDNFNAYVKLLINGESAKPFNMKTFPSPKIDFEMAKNIEKISINKYGVDRKIVEADILRRLRG